MLFPVIKLLIFFKTNRNDHSIEQIYNLPLPGILFQALVYQFGCLSCRIMYLSGALLCANASRQTPVHSQSTEMTKFENGCLMI